MKSVSAYARMQLSARMSRWLQLMMHYQSLTVALSAIVLKRSMHSWTTALMIAANFWMAIYIVSSKNKSYG